jgi:hypothetical protein
MVVQPKKLGDQKSTMDEFFRSPGGLDWRGSSSGRTVSVSDWREIKMVSGYFGFTVLDIAPLRDGTGKRRLLGRRTNVWVGIDLPTRTYPEDKMIW